MSNHRDTLFSEFRRTKDQQKLEEAKSLRNQVKTALGQAKNLYFLNELDKKGEDPKKFWRDLHKLLNQEKKGSNIGQL